MTKLAYYARPLNIYNTRQEERDKAFMKMAGFKVIDVNTPAMQEEYEREGMSVFKPMVKVADALFFRAFMDGAIPAGVGKEIMWARENGMPVFELPRMVFSRILDPDTTRTALMELGQR